jgi:acyl carrier protein phosphodiesterase
MNHLAHLFLAEADAESLIGNLAGDFVKGTLAERFTPRIRDGIRRHRAVDAFTDSHPEIGELRRRLVPDVGHYSGIVADMFLDHVLARDFERWSGGSLETFVARTFSAIDAHAHLLPEHLARVYPYMRDQQWLLSYRQEEGIARALHGISHRLSRRPDLGRALHQLHDAPEQLTQTFERFFPEVIAHARLH